MRLLLVDDEPLVLRLLERRVEEVLPDARKASFTTASAAMAYAEENPVDIAFLDINMRAMDGVTMAKKLQELYPRINIIFCTGYTEYMPQAFELYCSGYLVKPVSEEDIRKAVEHLRYPVEEAPQHPVRFQCFGNFEAYFEDRPISFKYNRTKELLAYLVDRNGVDCTNGEIEAVLFEDDNHSSYLRTLKKDLTDAFAALGVPEIIRSSKGKLGIQRDLVSCDYFDYRDGKLSVTPEEYMTQFSFGEATLAGMLNFS